MLLNIKVFTNLLDAKIVQKLTGVTYFKVSNMATVLKSERGTPIKQRLIIRHSSIFISTLRGKWWHGRLPITFYCS